MASLKSGESYPGSWKVAFDISGPAAYLWMTFFSVCSILFKSVADYNLDQGDRYVKTPISRRKVMSKHFQLSNVALIPYFSSLVRFSTVITSKRTSI